MHVEARAYSYFTSVKQCQLITESVPDEMAKNASITNSALMKVKVSVKRVSFSKQLVFHFI